MIYDDHAKQGNNMQQFVYLFPLNMIFSCFQGLC